MAGLDASIYGGIQPFQMQQVNPLAALGQMAQIDAYRRQADKYSRDEMRQNDLLKLAPQIAELPANQQVQRLTAGGFIDEAGKVATNSAKANNDQRAADKTQLEMALKRQEAFGGALMTAAQNPASAPQIFQQMVDQQIVDPSYVQKMMQGLQAAPDKQAFLMQGAQASVSAKDQLTQKLQEQAQGLTMRGQDLSAQTTMRGQDMTDARQRETTALTKTDANTKASTDIRKEFNGLQEVKNYQQAAPAFKAIEDAATRDTTASDINLVYGLAKLYDPTSVVREGEYATIANSPAIPERVKGFAQYLIDGKGRLTAQVKKEILDEARGRMSTFQSDYEAKRAQYTDVAQRSGADPTLVVDGKYEKPVKTRKTVGGKTYENDGNGWYVVN